ncbi:hypothetical protein, partial [Brevundimonas sp.]|uniref:hypothetical protein n=1 Tax=Brevundimonas sp. TaxID=1871086 RepID=UPI00391A0F5A
MNDAEVEAELLSVVAQCTNLPASLTLPLQALPLHPWCVPLLQVGLSQAAQASGAPSMAELQARQLPEVMFAKERRDDSEPLAVPHRCSRTSASALPLE